MYKTLMVASGNMNVPNLDTYYSRFISLCSMRTVVLLSELKIIETQNGDISNAYLTARTTYKIVLNYDPEFEPFRQAGHLILIKTELYRLKSSCARFHYYISYAPTILGFVPSMGGNNIWIRNASG